MQHSSSPKDLSLFSLFGFSLIAADVMLMLTFMAPSPLFSDQDGGEDWIKSIAGSCLNQILHCTTKLFSQVQASSWLYKQAYRSRHSNFCAYTKFRYA